MSLLHRARMLTGIEVSRYFPELDARRNFVKQLKSHHVDVVLDIGANSGQYAAGLRRANFEGRVVRLNPFLIKASKDPLWECHQYALGDHDGMIRINVAGNAGESSPVLPMLKSHRDAFPPANYVGTEYVPIRQLDFIAAVILRPGEVAFLKIDVQGFEKQVLAGGKSVVNDRCVGSRTRLPKSSRCPSLPLVESPPGAHTLAKSQVLVRFSPGLEGPAFSVWTESRPFPADERCKPGTLTYSGGEVGLPHGDVPECLGSWVVQCRRSLIRVRYGMRYTGGTPGQAWRVRGRDGHGESRA